MADINNKITTKVELNATQAQQEIAKLNAVASDSTKSLTEKIDAKNKATKMQEKLDKKNISNLEKEVKALTGVEGKEKDLIKTQKKLDATKIKATKTSESNIKQQNKLNQSLKDSKSSSVALDKASMGLLGSLKALAANPLLLTITLIVGALSLLKEAFTSSEEGQNRWNKITTIASTIVGNFVDLLADFADAVFAAFENPQKAIEDFAKLIKDNIVNRFEGMLELFPKLGEAISLLFKGEFSEAAKVAADAAGKVVLGVDSITDSVNNAIDATKKFVEEQEREIEVAKRIADQRAAADKVERALIVDRAKANRDRAAALEKSVDKENFSIKERISFLKEAGKIEQDITEKEIAAAKLRLSAKVAENSLSRSNKAALDEEANLRAKIIDLETAKLKKQRSVTAQISSVKKEEETENKRISDAKIKADQAEIDSLKLKGEETIELEQTLLDKKRQIALDNEKLTREEKAAINAEFDLKELQLEEQKKAREQEEFLTNQEALNERDAIELERRRMNGEETLAFELEMLEKKRQQDVSVAGLTAQEIQNINEKANIAKEKLNKASEAAEKAKDKAILDSAIGMAGEAFGISQELAVARAIMNAPEAISNVWSQAGKQPTLPQVALHGSVGTAMVVAPIIKGLANIKKARFPKAKKSGASSQGISSSASGGGAGASVAESAVSNLAANNAARIGVDPSIGANAESSAANRISGSSASNIIFSESAYSDFRNQVNFREERSTV